MSTIDIILEKLANHVRQGTYEQLESDTIEIKPIPSDHGKWDERYKSACAFMNTRGGILILGIKEEKKFDGKLRYIHTDYRGDCEEKIVELNKRYNQKNGSKIDVSDVFLPPMIKPFLDGNIVLLYVAEY